MISAHKNNKPGVYCFWHKATNKVYIGSAQDLPTRLNSHLKGHNSNIYLQNAIAKYGLDTFHLTQITTVTHAEAVELEQICLKYIFANNLPKYNISLTAGGGRVLQNYTEHGKAVSATRRALSKPCFALDLSNPQNTLIFNCNIEASEQIGIDRSIISRSCKNNKPCNSKTSRWLFSNISEEHLKLCYDKLTSAQITGGKSNYSGEDSGFYGHKHTAATKAVISEKIKEYYKKLNKPSPEESKAYKIKIKENKKRQELILAASHIEAQKSGGLSGLKYCKQNKISYKVFRKWKKLLNL